MLFNQGNPYRKGLPEVLRLGREDFHFGISTVNLAAVNRIARWSVFTFMAADDPALSASMFDDLMEMKSIGSTQDVHISAIFIGPLLTDSFFLRFNPETSFSEDIILRFLRINSDQKTLLETIINNAAIFPSEKKILILSGHGNGWKGLLPDLKSWKMYKEKGIALPAGDLDPNLQHLQECYQRTMQAIRSRFTPDEEYHGATFDVVAFDACKMANVEALVLYSDKVPYIIASEAPEAGTGYPYDLILRKLADHPEMDPEELAKQIVASLNKYYQSPDDHELSKEFTQAVFDGRYLPGLCDRIGSLASALISGINEKSFPVIKDCIRRTCLFNGGFMDLIGFALNLENAWISPEVSLKARSLIDYFELSGLVLYKEVAGGKHLPNGLSIYAPTPDDFSQDYLDLLAILPSSFLKWTLFLGLYYSWLSGEEATKNPLLPFLSQVIHSSQD